MQVQRSAPPGSIAALLRTPPKNQVAADKAAADKAAAETAAAGSEVTGQERRTDDKRAGAEHVAGLTASETEQVGAEEGWAEYFDSYGRAYYYCETSGRTTWEKPAVKSRGGEASASDAARKQEEGRTKKEDEDGLKTGYPTDLDNITPSKKPPYVYFLDLQRRKRENAKAAAGEAGSIKPVTVFAASAEASFLSDAGKAAAAAAEASFLAKLKEEQDRRKREEEERGRAEEEDKAAEARKKREDAKAAAAAAQASFLAKLNAAAAELPEAVELRETEEVSLASPGCTATACPDYAAADTDRAEQAASTAAAKKKQEEAKKENNGAEEAARKKTEEDFEDLLVLKYLACWY
jgi:hypothetical protein